jgi:hypothetical protein
MTLRAVPKPVDHDCGCTGKYHNGGCSDQNVVFWAGAERIPVSPTEAEIAAQRLVLSERKAHGEWPYDGIWTVLK